MTWEDRKRAYDERSAKISSASPYGILTEESIRAILEDGEKCSERRFGRLQDRSAAVNAIREATDRFASANNLIATIAEGTSSVAFPLRQTRFKYSSGFDTGVLHSALDDLDKGTSVKVSLVHEEDRMIAYVTAKCSTDGREDAEVKILDVDHYSRRQAGLAAAITVQGERFQVGVSHVALKRLLDELVGPVVTDATNEQSRYVFKSLGFVRQDRNSNPCILQFPPRN